MHPYVHCNIIYNSQIATAWEQPKSHRLMNVDRKCAIYIYICVVDYYSATKKSGILPFATPWIMDGPGGSILSRISQIKVTTV